MTFKATHGMARTRLYQVWTSMVRRCRNPRAQAWANYGGRGISVCERWLKFEHFYADMGDPQPGYELDRINNEGNYEPGNCRWATRKLQNRNCRTNVFVTFNGETKCLGEWAEKLNMNNQCLSRRLKAGWTVADAFTKPSIRPRQTS